MPVVNASEARSIGQDQYQIQQDLLIAAGRLISELLQRLEWESAHTIEFDLLDPKPETSIERVDDTSPVITVTLDEKKTVSERASALKAAIAGDLSIEDIQYIAKAIDAPASDIANPELNRNLTISVDGRDVLVVQDGRVLLNDILSRDNALESSAPAGQRLLAASEAEHVIDGEIIEETRKVDETERTDDVIDAEYSEVSESETPTSGTTTPIAILTRIVHSQSETSERLASDVEDLANAPEAEAVSPPETEFSEARTERLRPIDPPITRRQREEERQSILETASTLLDRYGTTEGGTETYDGNLYRIERTDPNTLSLSAKDGRGTIFQSSEGQISENLTPVDRYRFSDIRERLSLPTLEASKTRSDEHERG